MNVKRISDWDYDRLIKIAEEYGTPVYVTDLDRISQNYNRLNGYLDDITVKYAAKANSEETVLRSLKKDNQSLGLECASVNEAQKCHRAGYPLHDIQISLVNPPESSIKKAVKVSKKNPEVTVVIGAIDTVDRLRKYGYSGNAFLRIKVKPEGNKSIISEGAEKKFGIHPERLSKAAEKIQNSNFDFVGFHFHIGGSVLTKKEVHNYVERVENVFNIVEEFPYNVRKVNLGGGLGVPYHDDEIHLDLEYFKNRLYDSIPSWFEGEIIIEPGRYISADASLILSKANTVKEDNFVGIDCGLTQLIRPAMFGSSHPIENITNPDRKMKKQTLAGPTCSSADIICSDRIMTKIKKEDLIAIGNSGAYGYVLTNNFHSTPRPYSIVIKGDKQGVSVEGEKIEDIVEKEKTPDWLK